MKSNFSQVPLDLNDYQKYEIPQDYMAYAVELESDVLQDGDDLEFWFLEQHYKIFHSELQRTAKGHYFFKLIIGKITVLYK